MIIISESTGTAKFECILCKDNEYPCLKCSQQKAVYEIGHKDGSLNLPMELTGFNPRDTIIYKAGYTLGKESKI